MTEVFRNRDSATIGHIQSLLESEGIRTYLRNEYAASPTIAIPEVTPALCIIEDADVERGVELIRAHIEPSRASPDQERTCALCGERSPSTFSKCWNCESILDPSK